MNNKKTKVIIRIAFVLYVIVAGYFLFFAGTMGREHLKENYTYNLKLFKEIKRFVKWSMVSKTGFEAMVINVFGNVICFIPFGVLLPMNFKCFRKVLSVTLVTYLVSLVVETVQLITKTGAFDVDDILLNTLGGVIGCIIFELAIKKKMDRCE